MKNQTNISRSPPAAVPFQAFRSQAGMKKFFAERNNMTKLTAFLLLQLAGQGDNINDFAIGIIAEYEEISRLVIAAQGKDLDLLCDVIKRIGKKNI